MATLHSGCQKESDGCPATSLTLLQLLFRHLFSDQPPTVNKVPCKAGLRHGLSVAFAASHAVMSAIEPGACRGATWASHLNIFVTCVSTH